MAGGGTLAYGLGDGGPATQAGFYALFGVAVGPDGSFFIAEYGQNFLSDFRTSRISRVGPDGIITTVAGGGSIY